MSNLTYNVDINSNFRDVDRYPNPCDFAVSFKTNTSTGTYSYGDPIDNIFFNQCSIDPDFIDNKFKVENAVLKNYKKDSDGNIFICGTIPSGKSPIFYYDDIATEILPENIYPSLSSFFVSNITTLGLVNWTVYLTLPEGTFTGTNNYTTDANFTFDSIQNLTIMFDFTASNVIINKYENEVVNTLLTIENPRSSVSDCIFKLDSEGNLGQYDNRNWGYNIVSSNFDLRKTITSGNNTLLIDSSDSVISTINTNPITLSPYKYYTFNDPPTIECANGGLPAFTPKGNYLIKYQNTGYDYYIAYNTTSYNPNSFQNKTGGLLYYQKTSTGSLNFIKETKVTYPGVPGFTQGTGPNYFVVFDFCFVEVNNKLYGYQANFYIQSSAAGATGYVYSIDYATGSGGLTLLGGMPNLDYKITANHATGTDNIFSFGWNTVKTTVDVYKLDTSINTLSYATSGPSPRTSASVRHSWPTSWVDSKTGTNIYAILVEYNSTNSTAVGNTEARLFRYDTLTNTISLTSTGSYDYLGVRDLRYFKNSSEEFVIATNPGSSVLTIYKINPDYSLTKQLFTSAASTSYLGELKVKTGSGIKYFLIQSPNSGNAISFYNIDDIDNPIVQQTLPLSNSLVYQDFNQIVNVDSDNILYAATSLRSSQLGNFYGIYFYTTSYATTTLTNTHYDVVTDKTLTIPGGYTGTSDTLLSSDNSRYLTVPTPSNIHFYDIRTIETSKLSYSYSYSFTGIPYDISNIYYNDEYYLFVSHQNNCSIFKLYAETNIDILPETITFIQNIVSTTGSYIAQTFPVIINDTLSLFMVNNNNKISSYTMSSSVFNFNYVFSYTSFINYQAGFIRYYPQYNDTILTLYISNNNIPNLSNLININAYIGNPVNINISNPTGLFVYNYPTYAIIMPQTKNSVSTTFYNNKFIVVIGYDTSAYTSLFDSAVVLDHTDYKNVTNIAAFPSYYTDYNINVPGTMISTPNNLFYTSIFNSATGWTGARPPYSNDGVISNDYVLMSSIDINTNIMSENLTFNNIYLSSNTAKITTNYYANKTMLVFLLRNSSIYLYDVTDPYFSLQGQTPTLTSQSYNASVNFGNSFILKMNELGKPLYSSYLGGDINQTVISKNVNISNAVIDASNRFLYVPGIWTDSCQFSYLTSTGSFSVSTQLVKEGFEENGFVAKMNLIDGTFSWVIPLAGINSDIISKLQYNSSDDSLILCGYTNSPNMVIYGTQSGLTSTFPTTLQHIFNGVSATTGFILKLTSAGAYAYNNSIYSLEDNRDVKLYDIGFENNYVIVTGISNSSNIGSYDKNNNQAQEIIKSIDYLVNSLLISYIFYNGVYVQSNYTVLPSTNVTINDVKRYSSDNTFLLLPSVYNSNIEATTSIYNKDGTLAKTNTEPSNTYTSYIYNYAIESSSTNTLGQKFSKIYSKTPPNSFLENEYQEHTLFIKGAYEDPYLNKNFIIRRNFTGTDNYTGTNYVFELNNYIDTSKIVRSFSNINSITGTDNYFTYNLSSSELSAIGLTTSISTGPPSITMNKIFGTLDTTSKYYLVFPSQTGSIKKIFVTNITYTNGNYTLYVNNLSDLFYNSAYYGPYLYISKLNPSVYYNLQFFPGSIATPVYFGMNIISLTIPNRPLVNLSQQYGGQKNVNDIPYIYVSIYNEDDNGNVDSSIVNIVYDNAFNVLGLNPTPQYFIPSSNPSSTSNFVTFSTSYTPTVKFSPGFYNLRIKIMDHNGNVLVFDPSSTKSTDLTGQTIPDYLRNVYLRLSAKKI